MPDNNTAPAPRCPHGQPKGWTCADCGGPARPEATYGTTHLVPAPGTRGMACCGVVVTSLDDRMTVDPGKVTCPGRNEPLAADEAYAGMQRHDGDPEHPWAFLGEDGEQALMAGHGKAELLIAAMVAECGDSPSDYDPDDVEDVWLVFTEHMPDCREDREPDEWCSCDEFAWWATTATADTPGALPVTYWQV